MRLTATAKIFLTVVILAVVGAGIYYNPGLVSKIAPKKQQQGSNIPPVANLPDAPIAPVDDPGAGCASLPEVRFYHWAWNAQSGMMLATGGKQATKDSLMCQNGVNLKLIREDNVETMQSLQATFAERLKAGEKNPSQGAHFIAIMGDGGAAFLKGINDRLSRLGSEYIVQVVGSAGYSRGEDKFMGPPEWKANPQAARGGLVAGYLRDGDWNIAMKWLADNKIPNNPDDTVYDPDALNWVNANDYIDAAQKYITGYCVDLKNVKTGKTEKQCVNGTVTWTPGDVAVAEEKGGLVSIVSTKEYRSQMPNVIIGNKKWMQENRKTVEGMLNAIFQAGDLIKKDDEHLKKAAAISALVYNEKDAAYWFKYFRVQTVVDKQGLKVELGGSSVNNLADNLQLFGLAPGSTNLFAATYTVFGDIVKSQYPTLVPSYPPVNQILDTSYVQNLARGKTNVGEADVATFGSGEKITQLVSRRSWSIEFDSGKATFTAGAQSELEQLFKDLAIAGGTIVEIHGHTDNVGSADTNQGLSEARAFAVKTYLENKSKTNFPEGRIRVHAHGMTQPLAPNTTPDGRAKNRRVEIVLGTSG